MSYRARATTKDADYIRESGDGYYVTARGERRGVMKNKVLQPSRGPGRTRANFRKSGTARDYKAWNKGAITLCISMPPDVFAQLSDLARREGKNRSHLLRDLIEAHHATYDWKKP